MNTAFSFRPATARDFPAILALQNAVLPLLPEEQFFPDGPDFWQHCLQRGGCMLLALAHSLPEDASVTGICAGSGEGREACVPSGTPKLSVILPRVPPEAEEEAESQADPGAARKDNREGQAFLAGYFLLHCPLAGDKDNLGRDIGLQPGGDELGLVAHLELVLVHPLFHGQHLATTMGSLLLERARSLGRKYVCATVWPRNLASLRMLQHLGLRERCTKLKYGGLERAIMAREL